MSTFAPTALRASELARCARQCAYRGLGATAEIPDERAREYFSRGHLFEWYVVEQLRHKHGAENVKRQVEIEWPGGIGHADALVIPERLLVEVGSTVTPALNSPMFDMKVEQTKIYVRFCPDADRGALYIVNPSNLRPADMFRVELTDEDVERIDEQVAAVVAALEGGDLPARVCEKKGQARGRMCAFGDVCFEDVEDAEVPVLDDSAIRLAAVRLYRAKQAEKQAKAEADEARDELAALEPPYGKFDTGPLTVSRTHVVRQPSFSMKVAKAAGFPTHTLDEFLVGGSEYDTWRVDRPRDGDLVDSDDFGSEAPF